MIESTKKVVCIEDESEMIDLVRIILQRHHIKVIGALGGREGLEKVASEKPDLVLLDLKMPVMNGWEVYERMKASGETRHIPIVVLTAMTRTYDDSLDLSDGMVSDYITKPFRPKTLIDSVTRILEMEPALR